MFNSHVHTSFSPDCSFSAETMCDAAIEKGLTGINITDHCDMHTFISHGAYQIAIKSNIAAKELSEKYKGRLCVFSGIELGDAYFKPEYAKRVLEKITPDVVLLSIHAVITGGIERFLSRIDFTSFSEEELDDIVRNYFERLLVSACETDYDVLTHLTLPFRYINGVYKRNLSCENYSAEIKKVLSALIERGKALEINTSELNRQLFDFMPHKSIIEDYFKMGGRLVTIGTDAHLPENIATGFNEAKVLLRECGFSSYVHYEKRKTVSHKLH